LSAICCIFEFVFSLLHSIVILSINYSPCTQVYTLSLHDALPISKPICAWAAPFSNTIWTRKTAICARAWRATTAAPANAGIRIRSEEHTSELQSRENLVCRLLLEKKK